MRDALLRAIEALKTHENLCTQRWEAAEHVYQTAKQAEAATRWEMQEAAGLHERLIEFVATLKPEGQS